MKQQAALAACRCRTVLVSLFPSHAQCVLLKKTHEDRRGVRSHLALPEMTWPGGLTQKPGFGNPGVLVHD